MYNTLGITRVTHTNNLSSLYIYIIHYMFILYTKRYYYLKHIRIKLIRWE